MAGSANKIAGEDKKKDKNEDSVKEEIKKLKAHIAGKQQDIRAKGLPIIVLVEGWAAAGKGGNIRRISDPLDSRGCDVMPIVSPEPHELARQYLWRFWTRLPRTGHVCIFDRTWYGRVMVERIEGFCSEDDWKRAYNELVQAAVCLILTISVTRRLFTIAVLFTVRCSLLLCKQKQLRYNN